MQLLGDAADNPDQRIAEDIRLFCREGDPDRHPRARRLRVSSFPLSSSCGHFRPTPRCVLFGYEVSIPGYLVWAALIYADRRHRGDPLDRKAADQSQFPAAALRSRLPFQSRARARELRADRIAQGRGRGGRAIAAPLLLRDRQLARDHVADEAADLADGELRTSLNGVSFDPGKPGLFRRKNPARRTDADRRRFQQRAAGALDLHRRLPRAGGMARGGRPAGRLRRRHRAGAGDRRGGARRQAS